MASAAGPGSERVEAPRAAPWLGWLLVAGQCLLALSLAWQWLCASTERLYLDDRRAPASTATGGARQRFDLRSGRVEPQILAGPEERLAFGVNLPRASELRLRAVPTGEATVEIATVQHGVRRVLYRRRLLAAMDLALALPPTAGLLELSNHGDLRWSDPRLVKPANAPPALVGLLALLALCGLRAAHPARLALPRAAWARSALLGGMSAAIAASLGLAGLELGLRAAAARLPTWVTAARRDLGEMQADPRWQDSQSYGPRLAARVDTFCEWHQGDIVRMGFLAPGLARHPSYRFPFATDADGFRNSGPESAPSVVAALGDSFTDGLTLPAELTWPSRLASLLGVSVRNYGTAGFGPGQELLVLKEHVLARRPRRVVVGFFAGNDRVDAERFEAFQRAGGAFPSAGLGWEFKRVIARFDRLYLTSLYAGASGFLAERSRRAAERGPNRGLEDYSGDDPTLASVTQPGFERGLFTVPVSGRTLQFAFLPPYLNSLTFSRQQLQASRGWELTRRSYEEMARLVRTQGGELIVMFIPSKDQVYLPLLEASFPRAELRRALRLSLGDQPDPPELEVLMRNRLALNDLMREFCVEQGLPFLDLTADLQAVLQAGHNVYFPDDSHWNAAGHATAAAALARLLRTEGL